MPSGATAAPRLVALCFALVAVLLCGPASVSAQAEFRRDKLVLVTSSGEHAFDVEIAETPEQLSRGLMFRRSLGPREGMLFIHKQPELVTMWMRNTYISLDMIFIRPDGRVHRIEFATEPHSERIIASGDRVGAVLEVRAGVAAELGLKSGDLVRHPHFKPVGGG